MIERRALKITRLGEEETAELEFSTTRPWFVGVTSAAVSARGDGQDLLAALEAVGAQLVGQGWKLHCMGLRHDVHPSGMSRSMSDGRKAYWKHDGQQELVDIFDPSDD